MVTKYLLLVIEINNLRCLNCLNALVIFPRVAIYFTTTASLGGAEYAAIEALPVDTRAA